MITSLLIPKLKQRFPGRGLRQEPPPAPCALFPAAHPEVGDILLYDDGDEVTVVAGNFTHSHICNYEDDLTLEEKAEKIVEDVADFLEDMFADRIVLWGSHKGGGGWYFAEDPRGAPRKHDTEYVWSGPL